MPITRKQFELGIDGFIEGWMRKIHSFLAEQKDEAFTLLELADHLGVSIRRGQTIQVPDHFKYAVDALIWLGAVESRDIGAGELYGATYYAWAGPLEF